MKDEKSLNSLVTIRRAIKGVQKNLEKEHRSMKYTKTERKIIGECVIITKELNKLDPLIRKRNADKRQIRKNRSATQKLKKAAQNHLRQPQVKVTRKKKVGKKRKTKSFWPVSGGLPSLGKRR